MTEEVGTPRWRNLDRGQGQKVPSPAFLQESDQVHTPATPLSTEGMLVELEDVETTNHKLTCVF